MGVFTELCLELPFFIYIVFKTCTIFMCILCMSESNMVNIHVNIVYVRVEHGQFHRIFAYIRVEHGRYHRIIAHVKVKHGQYSCEYCVCQSQTWSIFM